MAKARTLARAESTGPPRRSSASADAATASRHEKKHPDTLTDQLVDNAVSRVGPTATVTVVTGPIALVALAAPRVRPASARAR
jgi:hypothetical protein